MNSPDTDTVENGKDKKDLEEDEKRFKDQINEIDSILEKLQTGDLELEDSLELYEEAIHLLRECKEILNRSEEKIEQLKEQGEDLLTEPFDPEEETEE